MNEVPLLRLDGSWLSLFINSKPMTISTGRESTRLLSGLGALAHLSLLIVAKVSFPPNEKLA